MTTPDQPAVRTSLADRLYTVTLDRPDRRNALTPGMLDELGHAVANVPPDARALIFDARGPAFCAGFDLSLCQDDSSALERLLRGLDALIASIHALDIPVAAAAHGAALAGGCALAASADVIFTDQAARLGYPVVRLGISPAVSAHPFTRAAGHAVARARFLDPGTITGAEAARLGLAHAVALPDDVGPAARAWAQVLASKPAHAITATKRWLRELAPAPTPAPLAASLSLLNSVEERRLLAAAWQPRH